MRQNTKSTTSLEKKIMVSLDKPEPNMMKKSSPNLLAENVETKGMLVRNMDERNYVPGNPFHEKLKEGSKLFGKILD